MQKEPSKISDIISNMLNKNAENERNIKSGFPAVDQLTNGFAPKNLHVIASQTAVGKSAFAQNIVIHNALELGLPVAIFSLEISALQLTNRLMASTSMVELSRISNPNLMQPQEWERLYLAAEKIKTAPIFIFNQSNLLAKIMQDCIDLKATHDLKLIVIDYLQLINIEDEEPQNIIEEDNESENERKTAKIIRLLKYLAQAVGVPILLVSQLNIQTEIYQNPPLLRDLSQYPSLADEADTIIFISTPPNKAQRQITVTKSQTGQSNSIMLRFIEQYLKFESVEPQESDTNNPK